ncbi:hypothetical protein D9758_004429 [Tetrapyrgos nigripes]|uniref:RNase H type-1 domain-containing protein n=1 Tax=Tetrapyrgos nigripes TaxID=182062 RepID=A0A8H5LSP0_9AGAR|nr:hypothetical protein D9758_004429 [Tetrapyrgos nigripes]
MKQALKLLNTLPPKWDPQSELPEDYQTEPEVTELDWTTFDNHVTTDGCLADIFHIFTDPKMPPTNNLPDLKSNPDQLRTGTVIIATDRSCENNSEGNARAGAGLYVTPGHNLNHAAQLPPWIGKSNQMGELVAAKLVVELTDNKTMLDIETDSKYVINQLT